jgi:hypothetical protein
VTIETVEGAPPFDYDTFPGNPPPTGLKLDPETGIISGTPDTPRICQFTLSAIDADFCIGSQDYSIIVNPVGCQTIRVSPEALLNAISGIPYEETLTADGGEAPYLWVVSTGALPD